MKRVQQVARERGGVFKFIFHLKESHRMKAAVIDKHGGLECVRIENIAEPKADENEVILDVRSAALNHLDIWVRLSHKRLKLSRLTVAIVLVDYQYHRRLLVFVPVVRLAIV